MHKRIHFSLFHDEKEISLQWNWFYNKLDNLDWHTFLAAYCTYILQCTSLVGGCDAAEVNRQIQLLRRVNCIFAIQGLFIFLLCPNIHCLPQSICFV